MSYPGYVHVQALFVMYMLTYPPPLPPKLRLRHIFCLTTMYVFKYLEWWL